MTRLLELTGVSRRYRAGDAAVTALADVDLRIDEGEFVAIMGASGSGKSTLMNIIGCLDRPSTGSYRIRDTEVVALDADALARLRRDTFGFVFQRYNLISTATAEENVEIPGVYAGLPRRQRLLRVRELLARLGLEARAGHTPSELSGGQQQRVAIARALMNDPEVILADEPTGALDSQSGRDVMALLAELHREGRTIVLVTHDDDVARHAHRIVQLRDGRVVADRRVVAAGTSGAASRAGTKPRVTSSLTAEAAEAARMALRSLRANLFRTLLTLLGIVIGVAAVVTMLAVGSGSQQKVLEQIAAMGTNLLSVRPGAPGLRGGGDIVTLTPRDAEAIRGLTNVAEVVPERGGRQTLRWGSIDYATTVQAVSPGMPRVRNWRLQSGAFFDQRDMQSFAPVIVLGQSVVEQLFPDNIDPVGQVVLVRNVPFEVVGTLARKGASMFGTDQDDAAYVPLTTGLVRLYGGAYVNGISVRVGDVDAMPATETAIRRLLVERHGVEDFSIRNMAALMSTAADTQETLTALLGAVAAISLLVGGIGVMNIMLVSVTERTREIGVRVATGARTRDILLQFNTEAAVVCTLGGAAGVAIGLGAAALLQIFGLPIEFAPGPPILAFACAFTTGLVFGYLPARKAARLDPIAALATE